MKSKQAARKRAPPKPPPTIAERRGELAETARLLWAGRSNLLSIWPELAFDTLVFGHRFLYRSVVVVSDPAGIQHVLATNAANYRKSVYTERVLKPLIGNGLFISHGELWQRQRRIAGPAFHRARVREFCRDMVHTGQEMVERWSSDPTAEIEVSAEMARVTAEVVTRAMFSDDLGADRARTVFEAFSQYQEGLGKLDLVELTGLPRWLPRLGAGKARKAVEKLDTVMESIISARQQGTSAARREDLLQLLMDSRDPETGQGMSRDLLRDEVAVIILAGHETTANTLAWAFYLLSCHPQVERRLHDELDTVLGGRTPEFDDIAQLQYTRALVDEVLRLYPPVHVMSREAIGDDHFCRRRITAGTMVVIAPWLLHRHRQLWDEPERFMPERFLPQSAGRRPKYTYLPFGAGPRVCLGSGFGLTESVIILAMAAQKFRLELLPGHPVAPLGRLTIRPSHGLPMRLHPR